jgi:hypothetical protein
VGKKPRLKQRNEGVCVACRNGRESGVGRDSFFR